MPQHDSTSNQEGNRFFPPTKSPDWLDEISKLYHIEPDVNLREKMKNNIKTGMRATKISDILKDSLFYSACGNDIRPISFFNKHIHSYVYALDTSYNMSYDTEFPDVKRRLKEKGYKKRLNLTLDREFLIENNWLKTEDDSKFEKLEGNWSIWEDNGTFFSLIFIYFNTYTLWKHLYQANQAHPKIFFFQAMFDGWKGGLHEKEGGEFIVNSEIYCDGMAVYRNPDFKE